MKQIIYYPSRRITSVINEDGYLDISYAGDIAERKFIASLAKEEVQLYIADGSFKMKIKPANIREFMVENMVEAMQTITINRKAQYD